MANAPVRDVLGPSEAALASASEVVRRWDVAFVVGVLVFAVVAGASMLALWTIGEPTLTRMQSLHLSSDLVLYLATFGKKGAEAWPALQAHPWIGLRVLAALLLATASSGVVFQLAARPMSRVRHIEGHRLLEGKEVKQACKRLSESKPWIRLHPWLGVKKQLCTRHMLITGGTGAGKTQILWPLIEQIVLKKDRKAIIYDVKGDFTAALAKALLISPWDARSACWDISADICTPQAAETFAQSLIPSKDGEFWGPAARTIVVGILAKLIHQKEHAGEDWGWRKLANSLAMDAYELHDLMAVYYPPGLRLLADPNSTTALNVLQTVSAHTRVIEQLAVAWDDGTPRQSFSLRAWARDRYKGPKQVIVQAGPDRELTARYIAAMINTLIPHVISPSLKDAEASRTLAFVLDEFTSIGKIDIAPLIDKGRSKGCVVMLGFQTIDQIKDLYGPNFASGLMSMVGTTIACRMGMGETQTFIANLFGKRRVAVTSHSQSPGSQTPSISQHEETRPVVVPSQIGDLGAVVRPDGSFFIRAIVSMGGDPMLMEFPGKALPKLRPEFVAAKWTKGVPKIEQTDIDDPVVSTAARLNNDSQKPEPTQEQDPLEKLRHRLSERKDGLDR